MDLARKLDWPSRYTARVLRNAFTERWHGRETELLDVADEEAAKYRAAWAEGDPDRSNTFVGEVAGLIRTIEPVRDIIDGMVREARDSAARIRPLPRSRIIGFDYRCPFLRGSSQIVFRARYLTRHSAD